MRILLDTHILLWMIANDKRLTDHARSLINEPANELFFSPVSIAEISIKHRSRPESVVMSGADARAKFIESGVCEMPFAAGHAACLDSLPPHHQDPFDRMLLAQAKESGLKIMSHDGHMSAYGDFVISV